MYALEMVVSKGDPVAGAQFVGAQGVPSLVGMMVRPAPSHANVVARAASSSALLGMVLLCTLVVMMRYMCGVYASMCMWCVYMYTHIHTYMCWCVCVHCVCVDV